MIRYWVWDRILCRWVRRVSTYAVWAATPRATAVLVCVGITGPAMAPLPPAPAPEPVVLASPEWPLPTRWQVVPSGGWDVPTLAELPPRRWTPPIIPDVPEPVPEPSGLLVLIGAAALAWSRLRKI